MIPGLGTYMLRALDAARRAGDPGGHDHVRRDLRDAQPDRRHQLRLPQPAGAGVVSGDEIFGQGPLAGDIEPSPQLVEDAGIALDEGVGRDARRRARGRARSSGCCATSPPSSRSAFLLLIILMAVFASLVAPHDPDAHRRTPRSRRRASTTRSAPTTSGATPSAASSTARGCRCAPASRSWASRCWSRCRSGCSPGFRGGGTDVTAHADHGRPGQLPAAGPRARGRRRARRRARERDPRHLDRDDPRLRAADARADARGAGGDVHRGVAVDGHEARADPPQARACPTSRRRSSSRCRSPSGSRSSPRPS